MATIPSNAALSEHVAAIRQISKRALGDIIEVGRRLSECKKIVGHGDWLPWLDREFGWTDADGAQLHTSFRISTNPKRF